MTLFYSTWIEILDKDNIGKLADFLEKNKEDSILFKPHGFSKEDLEEIIKNCKEDLYLLLFENDVLIGYGLLRGWDAGYEIPSLGIQIDRDHRGEGWGEYFMELLHDIAKGKGAREIRLTVFKNNLIARNLYKKQGYKFREYMFDRDEGILEL